MHRFIAVFAILFILGGISFPAMAAGDAACTVADRPCLLRQLEIMIPSIDDVTRRDLTYRELAKTYTYEGQTNMALAIIPKIQTPDTRAMTIRGIGMAAATKKLSSEQYAMLFAALTTEARKIDHPPSQAIAFTYIAMSQAFAGDDEGARLTASAMENSALRNKAYGETAEIDAERGDVKNALLAIEKIDTASYRNKAYDTVSQIFIDRGHAEEAYECAKQIDNPFLKAKSIQRILNKGNAEEQDIEPKTDVSKEAE